MWALTRVAQAEFWKAFRWNAGTPAAYDFLWLTVFFFLSSFLAFLGYAAHGGMWERFEQVLLGALPASSSPVRVSPHFVDRPEKITARLVEEFGREFPGLSLVPMRRFDGKTGTVVFPGLALSRELARLAEEDSSLTAEDFDLERMRDNERKIDASLSWGLSTEGARTDLNIFALPVDSPIWRWAARRAGVDQAKLDAPFPMVVVASKTLFRRHFRYNNYRAAVAKEQAVPCVLRDSLPAAIKDPTELKTLVIEVKEGRERSAFHAFETVWVDSFPMPEPVAFIMALPTIELVQAAESRANLDVHLESRGRRSQRIQKLWLRDVARDPASREKFNQMAGCLGAGWAVAQAGFSPIAAQEKTPLACNALWIPRCMENDTCPMPILRGDDNDRIIDAPRRSPLRREDVLACAARAGLGDIFSSSNPIGDNILADFTEETSTLEWQGPGRITVPCKALVESDFMADKRSGRDVNARCAEPFVDPEREPMGTAWLSGYSDALVYAKASSGSAAGVADARADVVSEPSTNLRDLVESLLNWRPDKLAVFSLDPDYESALVRFGVLSTLVDHIATPLGGGLAVLYLVLSSVILATAFMHRRSQYGLLAMNGVRPSQIQYLVCLQILLGCFIGGAVGYVAFMLTARLVNTGLASSKIVTQARELIGLDVPTFLGSPSLHEMGAIWLAMTAVSVTLGYTLLLLQGVSNSKAPIDLIKS